MKMRSNVRGTAIHHCGSVFGSDRVPARWHQVPICQSSPPLQTNGSQFSMQSVRRASVQVAIVKRHVKDLVVASQRRVSGCRR
jgi:hypothetical protein